MKRIVTVALALVCVSGGCGTRPGLLDEDYTRMSDRELVHDYHELEAESRSGQDLRDADPMEIGSLLEIDSTPRRVKDRLREVERELGRRGVEP